MEAKDIGRLLTNKQMAQAFGGYDFRTVDMKRVCQAQAKISFKVGQEEANFEWRTKKVPLIMEQFKKEGRKQVVEWINKEGKTAYIFEGTYTYETQCDNQLFLDLGDWQAFVKGIE